MYEWRNGWRGGDVEWVCTLKRKNIYSFDYSEVEYEGAKGDENELDGSQSTRSYKWMNG